MAKQLLQRERGDLIVIHHVPVHTMPTSFMDAASITADFQRDLSDQAEKKMEQIRIDCQDISGQWLDCDDLNALYVCVV